MHQLDWYGDDSAVNQNYDTMTRYVEYVPHHDSHFPWLLT
jgi:hypothetical protein